MIEKQLGLLTSENLLHRQLLLHTSFAAVAFLKILASVNADADWNGTAFWPKQRDKVWNLQLPNE